MHTCSPAHIRVHTYLVDYRGHKLTLALKNMRGSWGRGGGGIEGKKAKESCIGLSSRETTVLTTRLRQAWGHSISGKPCCGNKQLHVNSALEEFHTQPRTKGLESQEPEKDREGIKKPWRHQNQFSEVWWDTALEYKFNWIIYWT